MAYVVLTNETHKRGQPTPLILHGTKTRQYRQFRAATNPKTGIVGMKLRTAVLPESVRIPPGAEVGSLDPSILQTDQVTEALRKNLARARLHLDEGETVDQFLDVLGDWREKGRVQVVFAAGKRSSKRKLEEERARAKEEAARRVQARVAKNGRGSARASRSKEKTS